MSPVQWWFSPDAARARRRPRRAARTVPGTAYGTTRTVDQTIANLRKKLGSGIDIQSVRGEGYRLDATIGNQTIM